MNLKLINVLMFLKFNTLCRVGFCKKIAKKCILLLLFACLFEYATKAQENEQSIEIGAEYVGEYFSNFSGGTKTGQTYLGLIDFGISFNTEKAGLWKNGEFYIQFENTHGGSPTSDYLGDFQVASNIDNGDYSYLYEFWYRHQIGKLNLQAGLIDLNADYLVAEPGGLFLNSSFGIQPSASMNIPVPIFPMNALALNIQYEITDNLFFQTGIWDGDPSDLDTEPYNVKWNLSKEQGFLSASELHLKHSPSDGDYLGTVKLGFLYHSADFLNIVDSVSVKKGNMQFHLIAEQTVINKPEGVKGKLDAFAQVGYLPDKTINMSPFYFGGGINYTGLLYNNASDALGLAFAYAGISKELTDLPGTIYEKSELAIELTYSLPILDNIVVQPDLQYIVNTGAMTNLNNALAGFIRVYISAN